MKDTIRKQFFQCDCGAHAIVVEEETEVYQQSTGPARYRQEFSFAFFEYGHFQQKPGMWHRIKQAWRLLRTGTMFCDMVIMNQDSARKLGEFIIDNANNPGQGEPEPREMNVMPNSVLKNKKKLTEQQANEIEAEMRRLEDDDKVTKRELRLFMQSLMPCGHSTGSLLTCDSPPFGCVECNVECKK